MALSCAVISCDSLARRRRVEQSFVIVFSSGAWASFFFFFFFKEPHVESFSLKFI